MVLWTYQDVVDKDSMVGFSNLLPEYGKFKEFPKGTVENKLLKNHGYFTFDPTAVIQYRVPLVNQKMVAIGREVMVDSVAYAVIATVKLEIPSLRFLRV